MSISNLGLPMFLYFIRLKDQFVGTSEGKLKDVAGVVRIEQVSVLGGPTKQERGFQMTATRQHTMLIVRVQGERSVADIEKILDAGKTLDAIYQHEFLKLAD